MSRAAAWVMVLAACTSEITVEPVIDSPVDDPDASAFPALDEITLAVAHAGDDRDLVAQRFARGEVLELPGAPFGDDLVIHMAGFVGASNVAYGRTCEFVVDPPQATARPHLFFSRSTKFANTGITAIQRIGGRAVSLDGAAILIGGTVNNNPVYDIERFDPRTGAIDNRLATVGTVTERIGAVEALLGSSPARVVILGGRIGTNGADFLEVVDPLRPVQQAVETIDDAHMARIGLTATSLTDGRVIAIGGNAPGSPPVGTLTEIAVDGASVEVRDLPAVLAHPRTGHTATRLGDDIGAPVLIAGGRDAAGEPIAIAELFKPLTGDLARATTFAPQMIVPRSGHRAARMPDGSLLIIGGLDRFGAQVRTLELFSLDGGFVVVGELPPTAAVLDSTVTELADGRILIAGGRNAPNAAPSDTAFIARLDPLDGSVDIVPTDRLGVPRAEHQAARLCDGTVLMTGGTDEPMPAERYNPPPAGRR